MTLAELEDIHCLPKEIEWYGSQLGKLAREQKNTEIPPGMLVEYDTAVNEYRQLLIESRDRRKRELESKQALIDDITDPFMKAILIERIINGKTWWDVAESVSSFGSYTASSLKKHFYRHLRNCGIIAE